MYDEDKVELNNSSSKSEEIQSSSNEFQDFLNRVNHVSTTTRSYREICEALDFSSGKAILTKSSAFAAVPEVADHNLKT